MSFTNPAAATTTTTTLSTETNKKDNNIVKNVYMYIVRLQIGLHTRAPQISHYCETEEAADKELARQKQKDSGRWWVNNWEKVGPFDLLTTTTTS